MIIYIYIQSLENGSSIHIVYNRYRNCDIFLDCKKCIDVSDYMCQC